MKKYLLIAAILFIPIAAFGWGIGLIGGGDAAPAGGCGAISEVQIKYATSGAAEVTAVLGSTPTEGNLLTAVVYAVGIAIENMSIAGFSLAVSTEYSSVPKDIGLWYKVAGAAESTSVVATGTGSSNIEIIVQEWAGVNALDQIANSDNTGAVTEKTSGTTASTSSNDELLLAAWGLGAVSGGSESYTNSFTVVRATTNAALFVAKRIVSSTGAYESTFSWDTSRIAGGLIATFDCE